MNGWINRQWEQTNFLADVLSDTLFFLLMSCFNCIVVPGASEFLKVKQIINKVHICTEIVGQCKLCGNMKVSGELFLTDTLTNEQLHWWAVWVGRHSQTWYFYVRYINFIKLQWLKNNHVNCSYSKKINNTCICVITCTCACS